MKKIPTAEEYVQIWEKRFIKSLNKEKDDNSLEECFIEFAKLHVKAALEAASEDVKTTTKEDYDTKNGVWIYTEVIDRNSILNAYPLDNIK